MVAYENSHFSSLFAAEDISWGITPGTQRHTDDVKSGQMRWLVDGEVTLF